MKRFLTLVLVVVMILGSAACAFADEAPYYSDVNEDDYFCSEVEVLTDVGAICGYSDGTFRPNDPVTVAQFLKIMISCITTVETNSNGEWYIPYVNEAKDFQIITENMFSEADWNRPITRQECAAIAEYTSINALSEKTLNDADKLYYLENKFSDYDEVSAAYKPLLLQAVAKGIIAGYEDSSFRPDAFVTRAEASVIVIRTIADSSRMVCSFGETLIPIDDMSILLGTDYEGEKGYFSNDPARYQVQFDKCYIGWDGEPISWFDFYSVGCATAVLKDGTILDGVMRHAHLTEVGDYFKADINDIQYIVICDYYDDYTNYVFPIDVILAETFYL